MRQLFFMIYAPQASLSHSFSGAKPGRAQTFLLDQKSMQKNQEKK